VYPNQFYGTLKSEVDKMLAEGKSVIFDIDVEGALNLEKLYEDVALSIFIKPPSKKILLERLQSRKTETPESLKKRIDKATKELTYERKFDRVLVNEDLESALKTAEEIVRNFLK
jgi:guanylate kinase